MFHLARRPRSGAPLRFYGALILVASCLLSAGEVRGQVNTEKFRSAGFEGVRFEAQGRLAYRTGNVEILRTHGGLRFDLARARHHSFLVADYDRASKNNDIYLHRGFLHLRYVRLLGEAWGVELFGQWEFNDFVRLEERRLAGVGLRWRLTRLESRLAAHLGSGLMAEDETYDDVVEPRAQLIRSTSYVSVAYAAAGGMDAALTAYYQVAFEDPADYRILAEGTISFQLTQAVSYTTSLRLRHDSEPLQGVERTDLDLSVGLRVRVERDRRTD